MVEPRSQKERLSRIPGDHVLFERRRLWPVPGGFFSRGSLHPALLDGKSGPKVTQLEAWDAAQEAGTLGLWCLPMSSSRALPPLAAAQPPGVGAPSAGTFKAGFTGIGTDKLSSGWGRPDRPRGGLG